jgi:hypothetical protein
MISRTSQTKSSCRMALLCESLIPMLLCTTCTSAWHAYCTVVHSLQRSAFCSADRCRHQRILAQCERQCQLVPTLPIECQVELKMKVRMISFSAHADFNQAPFENRTHVSLSLW